MTGYSRWETGDRVLKEGDGMTGYSMRKKTEANDHSLCVVFMTEGDYSCVVFHSTVHQVCKLRVKLVI